MVYLRMAKPVLIVEDDKKISKIVKVYLEGAGYRTITAEKGGDAIDAASREPLALVILDLMLPDMTGEAVCQELRELGNFPIIMLTAKSAEDERVAGFALGADDYVVKPFSPRELVARVKAVMKRAGMKDESARSSSFNGGKLRLNSRNFDVVKDGRRVVLTSTEFKILSVLSGSPGRVFTRGELVETALGYHFEGYERSIDAHIKNLRQKIEDDPKTPLFILTVYGVGYKFAGTADDKEPVD
jgi:DNA-binding response OmpR family regulator